MSTQDATAAVNFNRCCNVLPAIGALWTAAENQAKAGAVSMPSLEAQCIQMSCASGASGKRCQLDNNGRCSSLGCDGNSVCVFYTQFDVKLLATQVVFHWKITLLLGVRPEFLV
jgi:hypothetical protein